MKEFVNEFEELKRDCMSSCTPDANDSYTHRTLCVIVDKIKYDGGYSYEEFNSYVNKELYPINNEFAEECKKFVHFVLEYLSDKCVNERRRKRDGISRT